MAFCSACQRNCDMEIDRLRAENEALRALLLEYGTHDRICGVNERSGRLCNCGWETTYAALAAKVE